MNCSVKGTKLVEIESPEEDAYIRSLANTLTGTYVMLLCILKLQKHLHVYDLNITRILNAVKKGIAQ